MSFPRYEGYKATGIEWLGEVPEHWDITRRRHETDNTAERGEWVIQRCTQHWIGTELQYEDWPGYADQLMTRTQMVAALDDCNRQWPQHEFRGHNVFQRSRLFANRHVASFPPPDAEPEAGLKSSDANGSSA